VRACSIRDPTVANPAQARLKPLKLKGAVFERNHAVKSVGEKLCIMKPLAKLVGIEIRTEEVRMSCRTTCSELGAK
jgi:hypothetical protein